jgi:hypothetical protein
MRFMPCGGDAMVNGEARAARDGNPRTEQWHEPLPNR